MPLVVTNNTVNKLLYRLQGRVSRVITDALETFGKEIINENTARIPMRLDPYGQRQKENAIATYRGRLGYKEVKRKRLGHDVPLWDTGHLKDAGAYSLYRGMLQVILRPPKDRIKIIGYLRYKGYRYWDIPNVVKGEQPSVRLRRLIVANIMSLKRGI